MDQVHADLVARPTGERRDVCLPITGAPDWQMRLTALVTKARTSEALPTALTRFHPDLDYAHQPQRRARGVALASRGLNSDRTYANEHPEWGDNSVIEVQLFEDGGLRLYMSRFSTGVSSRYQPEKGEEQMLFDGTAANRLHGRRRYEESRAFSPTTATATTPTRRPPAPPWPNSATNRAPSPAGSWARSCAPWARKPCS